jgi:hypothetical protein
MERETGIEPATFSLGKWLQIENKEHSEFGHLFQAIDFRQNSQFSAARLLMVFKWSSTLQMGFGRDDHPLRVQYGVGFQSV